MSGNVKTEVVNDADQPIKELNEELSEFWK